MLSNHYCMSSLEGHADEDGDNRISEQEYRNVLHTPEAGLKQGTVPFKGATSQYGDLKPI